MEAIEGKLREFGPELEKEYPLFFLEMNRAQLGFVKIKNSKGKTPRRRLFEAGNKCLTYHSLLETPEGEIPIGELYDAGKPFRIWAWNGERRAIANASAPFKKEGGHPCYRFEMEDGKWLETADHHYILTSKGWFSSSDLHDTYSRSLQESNSEHGLSILPSGVVRLSGRQSSFPVNCYLDFRQCDGQPRTIEDISQVFVPLDVDAQEHSVSLSLGGDVQVNRHTNTLSPLSFLLSIWDGLIRFADQSFESAIQAVCKAFPQSLDELLLLQRLSIVEDVPPQSYASLFRYPLESSNASYSCDTSSKVGNRIVAINRIPSQEVFDMEVDEYHNYFAGGLINHNSGKTQIGIAEDLAHSFGYRPWLEPGDKDYKIDVKVPNKGVIGCETLQHSVMEKIWPVLKELIPKTCRYAAKNDHRDPW